MSPTEDFSGKNLRSRVTLVFRFILILILLGGAVNLFFNVTFYQATTRSLVTLSSNSVELSKKVDSLQDQSKGRSVQQTVALVTMQMQLEAFTLVAEAREKKYDDLVTETVGFVDRSEGFVKAMKEAFAGFTTTITTDLDTAKSERETLMAQMRATTQAARASENTSRVTRHKVEQRLPRPTPRPWFHFP